MTRTTVVGIDVARRAQRGPLRAVDYLRVSTEDQLKGYGIQYTGKKTKKHIEKKCWLHVGTFVDEGISGSVLAHERDDLPRLMAQARQVPRPFDVVVVAEGRAIGRAGRAFWPWVWELEDLGVFVAVVKGDFDNTTPEGRSRMRKAADAAEDEREMIRDRTQGGIQEKAEDGRHPGGQARYGYYIAHQGKVGQSYLALDECDNRERCTRTDPCTAVHETAVLRRGRELLIQFRGNWSKAVLALNAEGLVSRSGRPWSMQNFRGRFMAALDPRYVFRSAANAALDVDGNPIWGESVTIDLDPVFTEDEVAEFRRACDGPVRTPVANGRVYPLSGRITSLCGAHYVGGTSQTKGVSAHYQCAGKRPAYAGAPTCNCSQLDAAGVEEWVWSDVVALLGDVDRLRRLAALQTERSSEQRIDHAARLAELDQHVAEQETAIAVAMAAGAKQAARRGLRGAEAEASVSRMIKPLEDELDSLEEQRRQVALWQADAVDAARRAGDLEALAQMAAEGLQDISPEDQAQLYKLLDITGTLTGPVPQMRKGPACALADWFREHDRLVPVLTDENWALVAPLFRRGDDRAILAALLRKAATGARWRELESELGTTALRSSWRRWHDSGLWERVMDALPAEGREVPRRHPLPPIALHGELQPGLILSASEGHAQKSGPSERCSYAGYRFSLATVA